MVRNPLIYFFPGRPGTPGNFDPEKLNNKMHLAEMIEAGRQYAKSFIV